MTDSTGDIAETMDYFPFGGIRIDTKAGTFNEQRKYIGQEYDTDTGLNYLNARYYNSSIGRFTSEDPQFWGNQNLTDPQSLNSYSYGSNNPITMSDPTGQFSIQQAGMFALGFANAYFNDNLGGFRRGNSNDFYYTAGQSYGDKTAMAQGAAEISAAINAGIISNVGGAVFALPTGGLSLGSALAIDSLAAGAALHGGSVSAIAGYNFSKMKGGKENNWGNNIPKVGDKINGAEVTKHAADQAELRDMSNSKIKNALESGNRYYDTKNRSNLWVVGERNKGGYSVVTTPDGQKIKTVQDFVPNLSTQEGKRFIKN